MSDQARYGLGAFLVGVLMVSSARMNGQLSLELGSPVFASLGSFGTGTTVLILVAISSRRVRSDVRAYLASLRSRELSPVVLLDGILAAVSVTSQAFTIGVVGVVVFTVTMVSANLCCGLVYDRLGSSPAGRISLTPGRYAAAALVVAAAVLSGGRAVSSPLADWTSTLAICCTVLAGCLLGFQQSLNARTQYHTGSFYVSVLQNFAAGTVVLAGVTVVVLISGVTVQRPAHPWLVCSGVIALVMVGSMGRIVGRIGVLSFGVAATAGQLTGATVLDLLAPVNATVSPWANTVACLLAMGAVALSVGAQRRGRGLGDR